MFLHTTHVEPLDDAHTVACEVSVFMRRYGCTTWCTAGWTKAAFRLLLTGRPSPRLPSQGAATRLRQRQLVVTCCCIRYSHVSVLLTVCCD